MDTAKRQNLVYRKQRLNLLVRSLSLEVDNRVQNLKDQEIESKREQQLADQSQFIDDEIQITLQKLHFLVNIPNLNQNEIKINKDIYNLVAMIGQWDKEKTTTVLQHKKCQNCHLKFLVKKNDKDSCLFHWGPLKYFSCRSCGGDEYFACCLKCKKCSLGCRRQKHTYS